MGPVLSRLGLYTTGMLSLALPVPFEHGIRAQLVQIQISEGLGTLLAHITKGSHERRPLGLRVYVIVNMVYNTVYSMQ